MPAVTIIIATHNRPDELCAAIESLRLQTMEDWQAMVIGDDCGAETGERLAALREPRLRYINLKARVGEQSGPNAVGMTLSDTPFIAFLNQDDLWLPDHLAQALDSLNTANAGFFTGRAAFAIADPDNRGRAILSEATPAGRKLRDLFAARYQLFEPISAWVMTAETVRMVGPFQQAAQLFRTPLEDWVLRSWRSGIVHTDSTLITVLKNDIKWAKTRQPGALYQQPARPLDEWLSQFSEISADAVRARIASDLAEASRRGLARNVSEFAGPGDFPWVAERLLTPAALEVFERTGWDAMQAVCAACRLKRGWFLRRLLRQRTGEALPVPPGLDALLTDARAQLQAIAAGNAR